jgi:hypothetical protein
MKRAYQALLALYPSDYSARFAPEMLLAFERAAEERRKQRRTTLISFVLAELTGLLIGAAAEWIAKFTSSSSVRGRCLPDLRKMRPTGVPRDVWFAGAPATIATRQSPEARENLCAIREKYQIHE